MAQYRLLKDVTLSINKEAILFRAGRILDEAFIAIPLSFFERAGANTVGPTLEQIKPPPIIGGLPVVNGTGVDNYNIKLIATNSAPMEVFRVDMPDADTQLDLDITLNATAPNGDYGAWKYNLSYARAAGAPALHGASDPLSAKGNNADAPPTGWTPSFAVSGNAVVVSIATVATATVYANAQAVRTKGG